MSSFDPVIIQSFLDHIRYEKRYSYHTIISYETDLTGFRIFLNQQFPGITLGEVTHHVVRSWMASLKNDGLTSRSINRKLSTLKSFFNYHLRTGTIDRTPMTQVVSPKNAKRLPTFMREEETVALLQSLDIATEDWKSLNAKMLVTIFYATGMRLSELINLKTSQIDIGRKQLKVLGKGNKERVIPVSAATMKMMEEYDQLKRKTFAETGEYLLVTARGKKMGPRHAYQLVNEVLQQADTLDKKSPHILRHTFATHLVNNGADLSAIKDLLGHSSLAATQVYTHASIEKLKEVHRKAHPRG